MYPGCRAVRPAEELSEPVVAEPRRKIPQSEHVLEELVHRGPPWRIVAGNRAALCLRRVGYSPEQKISVHSAPAERKEATHSALPPGRGC